MQDKLLACPPTFTAEFRERERVRGLRWTGLSEHGQLQSFPCPTGSVGTPLPPPKRMAVRIR